MQNSQRWRSSSAAPLHEETGRGPLSDQLRSHSLGARCPCLTPFSCTLCKQLRLHLFSRARPPREVPGFWEAGSVRSLWSSIGLPAVAFWFSLPAQTCDEALLSTVRERWQGTRGSEAFLRSGRCCKGPLPRFPTSAPACQCSIPATLQRTGSP